MEVIVQIAIPAQGPTHIPAHPRADALADSVGSLIHPLGDPLTDPLGPQTHPLADPLADPLAHVGIHSHPDVGPRFNMNRLAEACSPGWEQKQGGKEPDGGWSAHEILGLAGGSF
jgi:hypothetical protein